MKKKILFVAAASLFFGGCGTKTVVIERKPDTTAVQQPVITSNTYKDSETLYIEAVSSRYPTEVSSMGKKMVIDFGHLVCNAIDNGLTVEQLALMADSNNVDVEMVGYLTGAAISYLCPENQWFVDSAL